MTTERTPQTGPYMNDDGDWWVPVGAASFSAARDSVVGCLSYSIPEDGTLRYTGKHMAWLDSAHEAGCGDECQTRRHLLAYHFEENRKW